MKVRKEIMEEEIVCNRERDLADERITITNIKISSSGQVLLDQAASNKKTTTWRRLDQVR